MKQKLTLAAVAVLAMAASNGFAQSGAQGATTPQETKQPRHGAAMRQTSGDSAFVTKAMQGGIAEVELGKLAEDKGSSETVKNFGKKMVEDHSKANDELKTIASGKGMTLPTAMDSKSETMKGRLSGMSGAEFDRAYMQDMVSDHQKDVAEFRKEANSGSDAEVKAFAAKTLPILEEHLKLAQSGLAEVKKGGSK